MIKLKERLHKVLRIQKQNRYMTQEDRISERLTGIVIEKLTDDELLYINNHYDILHIHYDMLGIKSKINLQGEITDMMYELVSKR